MMTITEGVITTMHATPRATPSVPDSLDTATCRLLSFHAIDETGVGSFDYELPTRLEADDRVAVEGVGVVLIQGKG